MCVLIVKPAGAEVPPENMRASNVRNNDGIGIAWLDSTGEKPRIRMWKHVDPKKIDLAIEIAAKLKDVPAIMHFRYATHGTVSRRNVHPFYADASRQVVVGHNGVLGIRPSQVPYDLIAYLKDDWYMDGTLLREVARLIDVAQLTRGDNKSDTRLFAEHVIGNLNFEAKWWTDPKAKKQVEHLLSGDRMALLTTSDGLVTLNESNFVKDDGVLYSNSMYKPTTSSFPYSGNRVGTTSGDDEAYERAWRDHYSKGSRSRLAEKELNRTLPFPVDAFTPADKDDFLVGYFFPAMQNGKGAAICVNCCKERPKEEVASGLFNSDLRFALEEKCDTCKMLLEEIADALFTASLKNEQAVEDAIEEASYAPCVVCGQYIDECVCGAGQIAGYTGGMTGSGDPNDEPPQPISPKAAVTKVPTLAEIAVNSQTCLGMSSERLKTIVRRIVERGGNAQVSLFEASEKYPDLFFGASSEADVTKIGV